MWKYPRTRSRAWGDRSACAAEPNSWNSTHDAQLPSVTTGFGVAVYESGTGADTALATKLAVQVALSVSPARTGLSNCTRIRPGPASLARKQLASSHSFWPVSGSTRPRTQRATSFRPANPEGGTTVLSGL